MSRKRFIGVVVATGVVVALGTGVAVALRTGDAPTHRAFADEPIGANVAVTAQRAPAALKAVAVAGQPQPVAVVAPLGPVVSVTPHGPLPEEVRLRFVLARKVQDPATVLIGHKGEGDQEWSYLKPDEIAADGMSVTVRTRTLSSWWPFEIGNDAVESVRQLVSEVRKQVVDGLTGGLTERAAPPVCAGTPEAERRGHQLSTSGGDPTLLRCLGMEDGDVVLKVVNAVSYPLQVQYKGLNVKRTPPLRFNSSAVAKLTNPATGYVIVYPYEEVTFQVANLAAGASAGVRSEFGGYANSLYQLEFGLRTLAAIMTRFGLGGGVISNGAIAFGRTDQIMKYLDKVLTVAGCVDGLTAMNPGKVLAGCLNPAQLVAAFGSKGLLLAILTTAGGIAAYFTSQLQALVDLVTQRDRFEVYVSRTTPLADLAGTWRANRVQMVIGSNGTASETYRLGACNDGRMCTGTAQITLKTADGKIFGEYTSYAARDETGAPPFDSGLGSPYAGLRFRLDIVEKGVLKIVYLGADASDFESNNPYRCALDRAEDQRCF